MALSQLLTSVALIVLVSAIVLLSILGFADSNLAVGLIGLAGAIVSAAWQYRTAKDHETKARLFTEKQKFYTELIYLITDQFSPIKDKRPKEVELVRRLLDVKRGLLVWGSYETLQSLDSLQDLSSTPPEDAGVEGMRWLGRVIVAIRSDLGHDDPASAAKDLALSFLAQPDRDQLRMRI